MTTVATIFMVIGIAWCVSRMFDLIDIIERGGRR